MKDKPLDTVWMVVMPKTFARPGVVYEIGTSAKDVWARIEQNETMGTGKTAYALKKQGYRAKRVHITLA